MSRVKIDREDKNRVLLTELLPYELPMLISNDGFYSVNSKGYFEKFEKYLKSKGINKKNCVPFNFEVCKSTFGEKRMLSLIHPLIQLEFVNFYEKYDSVILHQCSKSPFSLRKVSRIAKYCYSPDMIFEEDELVNKEVEVVPETLDRETKLLKSYFTYEPIDLIYKFYDRYEFQKLEQRFNLLLEFDISKCFYNIYTHSICWAVKGKEYAKQNRGRNTFENSFDKLMQESNYKETNGIVVGPEISRIFAEIILQQIDLNVLRELSDKKLKFGVDYEVRRYVDDFFIYSNYQEDLDLILKTYKRELEFFKLYLNESKTLIKTTPFITNIAVGKRELNYLLRDLFNQLLISDENDPTEKLKVLDKIRSPYALSRDFVKNFQCIVQRNNLKYEQLNKDIIRHVKKFLVKILKDDSLDKSDDIIENVFLFLLDTAFYAYSLNITSSATFKLAQIIVLICKFLECKGDSVKQNVYSKIFRESDFVMTVFQRKLRSNETNIEILNLLIAIRQLGEDYLFTERKIRTIFKLFNKCDFDRLNYFHIVTLLYYFGHDHNKEFDKLKNEIIQYAFLLFEKEDSPLAKSELFLLFFDMISCPFIDRKLKKKLVEVSKYARSPKADKEISEIQSHSWFMRWETVDLERILKKKEWGASY